MKAVRIVLISCAAAAFAQYPGGPFPGGGPYPGGNPYPRTGPYPGGQQQPQQQPQGSGRRSNSKNAPVSTTTTEGIVRRATPGQLVIQADDHRVIWYGLSTRTTTQRDGKDADVKSFDVGDRVQVDSTEDDNGNFTAVAIQWLKAGTVEDRANAARTWDLPGASSSAPVPASTPSSRSSSRGDDDDRPVLRRSRTDDSANAPAPTQNASAQPAPASPQPQVQEQEPVDNRPATTVRPADTARDSDDPGPPQLRRGAARRTSAPVPQDTPQPSSQPQSAPVQTAANTPQLVTRPPAPRTLEASAPILPQEDSIIQKAREVAGSFIGSLPNFFCQQMTTRYQSDNPRAGWHAIDIVTADVAYEEGRESYKNIKVGGKPVNKRMEDIGGTRSTGEFATELVDLMSPETGASFRRTGQDTIRGHSAYVFKFEVPRDRSVWRIEAPSQLYYPAYSGSIWIDKETSRVLRIEQEAKGMPVLFPFDTVETATDYDLVRLAANEQYLLPVESETLNCERGTSLCARNKLEFRNYRKFGAQSSITFGDAQN